jgi:hypothetical protein
MTEPSQILKDERLLEWRLERFAEPSLSAAESSELAESEADWHLAAVLASAGSRSSCCVRSSSRTAPAVFTVVKPAGLT